MKTQMKKTTEYNGGVIEMTVYQPDKDGLYKLVTFAYARDKEGYRAKEDVQSVNVISDDLFNRILEHEGKAKRFIDIVRNTEPFFEERLKDMGFE
jgi:hypothetical protein